MACCCVVTSTGSVKIIEQLGKFKKVAMPGLEFIVPCIDQVSGTLSMRLQQMEVACETKTKDNVFVVMKVSIQYQIIEEDQKIQDAHYRLTSPAQQVSTAAAAAAAASKQSEPSNASERASSGRSTAA